MIASAVRPMLTLVPPRDKDLQGKDIPDKKTQPPAIPGGNTLDLINRFDEERLNLESFLDGIYRIAFSGHYIEINTETILVFAGKAETALKEMDKVFEEIIKEKKED